MDTGRIDAGDIMPGASGIESAYRGVQDRISGFLSAQDGVACREDRWDYDKGDGGGVTRVWENANFIEKGGVNFSAIHGSSLPPAAATSFKIDPGTPFFATGVSLVIHPHNPHLPTIHMNIRYFEAGEIWWFGGGIDLTPYVPVRDEAVAFHRALKKLCDDCGEDYAQHKRECDDYFYIKHRGEMRGIGGIFFDHLRANKTNHLAFTTALGDSFIGMYGPLIAANRAKPFTPGQREFQLFRRSRYVEFNLVYDRGTLFGLQSGGRTESILMSLPAVAHWRYDWKPDPGTPEDELTTVFLQPRDWINLS
ncbi:MAG: oxygen-dependent coproporphyrinogen oxidase [Candidatus Hydrogenedentes bacterium]|nr:oxygen-dependent coproporphyrinogen oxidase [Candidatus Hydrogenedentota bacterium]